MDPCYKAALPEKCNAIDFTSDGQILFAGGISGNIYIWQVSTGQLLRTFIAHERAITALKVSQDDSYVYSSGEDCSINAFCVADLLASINESAPSPIRSWSGHVLPVTSFIVFPKVYGAVLSVSADKTMQLWSLRRNAAVASWTLPSPITSLTIDPTYTTAIVGGADGSIHCIPVSQHVHAIINSPELPETMFSVHPPEHPSAYAVAQQSQLEGHLGSVKGISFSTDGSILASVAQDGLRLWDFNSRQTLKHLTAFGSNQASSHSSASLEAVVFIRPSKGIPQVPMRPFQRTAGGQLAQVAINLDISRGRRMNQMFDETMQELMEGNNSVVERMQRTSGVSHIAASNAISLTVHSEVGRGNDPHHELSKESLMKANEDLMTVLKAVLLNKGVKLPNFTLPSAAHAANAVDDSTEKNKKGAKKRKSNDK